MLNGAKYSKGGGSTVPFMVYNDFIMVSGYGLQYLEDKLGIQATMTSSEKLKEVSKKAGSWGYKELKDFAVKVTAELIKG